MEAKQQRVFFIIVRKRVFVCEATNAPAIEVRITVQDAQRRLNCSEDVAHVSCSACPWRDRCGTEQAQALRLVAKA